MTARHYARALALTAALATGCGGEGRPDHDLKGLVETPKPAEPINVELAVSDPAELSRALATPHALQAPRVGAHKFVGTSRVVVKRGDEVLEDLRDETRISFAADGSYAATLHNDKQYGRDAIYVDGWMYLRPRFGKYHRRRATNKDEPGAIRSEIYGTLWAYLEPMWPRVEVTDGGRDRVAERPARIAKLSLAGGSRERAPAKLEQRKWRDSIAVESVTGTVALDADTGAVLRAEMSGQFQFVRDAKQLTMVVTVEHTLLEIGSDVRIAAPAPERTVSAARETGEVDDGKALLKDLVADPDKRPKAK